VSEPELWNELGNLYFLTGAYEPAISAYSRAIQLEDSFGRPYVNLALAYVQKGNYKQAIELYRLSIALLTDNKEKAATWYKLGNVHRQLKDYSSAVLAYQKADELNPESCDQQEEPGRDHEKPLVFSMPPFRIETDEKEEIWLNDNHIDKFNSNMTLSPESIGTETHECVHQPFDLPPDGLEIPENIDTVNSASWRVVDLQVQCDWDLISLADETISNEDLSLLDSLAETAVPDADEQAFSASDCFEMDHSGTNLLVNSENDSLIENEKIPLEPQTVKIESMDVPAITDVKLLESENAATIENELEFQSDSATDTIANEGFAKEIKNNETMETDAISMEIGEPESTSFQLTSDEIARIETEIAKIKRKVQINPYNAFAWDMLGNLYRSIGNYEAAVSAYQQAIAIELKNPSFHYHLGLVYAAERRIEDAVKVFRKVIEIDPGYTLAHASLGGYYRKMGLVELARHHIEKATSKAFQEENEYNRACLESICGNKDRALELLQIALQNRQSHVNWARRDPDLDFIRNDPRFHMIISAYANNQPYSIH